MNPFKLAPIFVPKLIISPMKRLFYILYTWCIFVPIFLVLTLLTALTTIVGCLLGGERIFSYYPGMIWSRLTCYLALCPVKVRGREHIRRGQSYIFSANHQGAFDIFLIYGFLGVPIKWVMKAGIGGCRKSVAQGGIYCDFPGRLAYGNRPDAAFQKGGFPNGG